MRKLTLTLSAAVLAASASSAFAGDIAVVKFRADDCQNCAVMENQLGQAMAMVGSQAVKEVTIDTTNALKWEVSAHRAFDSNVVPQFNQWVGLTGFAAIVDTRTRRTIGCVSDKHDAYKMASLLKSSVGMPHDRTVSNMSGQFKCPATYNVDNGQ